MQEVIRLHEFTLSSWKYVSYRNQSIELLWKSMDWFLYVTYLTSVMKELNKQGKHTLQPYKPFIHDS